MALPTAWDVNNKSILLDVDSSGLEVNYRDCSRNNNAVIRADNPIQSQFKWLNFLLRKDYSGNHDGNHDAIIRTDNPIPSQCELFYFEIDIVNNEDNGTIAIGFCTNSAELNRMPGCEKNSWGYHSDDGNFFGCSVIDMPYGPTFTTGDTIGCCLNFRNNTAFYTKNGVNLGIAFRDLKDNLYPCIGIKSQGASIKANFGYKFKYAAMTNDDIDDELIKDRWVNIINQCNNQEQNMLAYLTETRETNNINSLRYRGKAYFVMGEYKKALEDLTKLLEIVPNDAFALRYRGETYLLLNEYEKSYADVVRLLSTGNYRDIGKVANKLWVMRTEALDWSKGRTARVAAPFQALGAIWLTVLLVVEILFCPFFWLTCCVYWWLDACLICFMKCCCVVGERAKNAWIRVANFSIFAFFCFAAWLKTGNWSFFVLLAVITVSILVYIWPLKPLMKILNVWIRRRRRARFWKDRARAREGRTQNSKFGKCENCNRNNTYYAWCQTCDPEKAIEKILKSSNDEIDECIKKFQLKAIMNDEVIEWIPFNRLSNIKKIGKGGFGSVFSATWLDGIRTTEEDDQRKYVWSRETSSTVALKTLSNSQDLQSSDFLHEFENHMQCKLEGSELNIYGLTQCTEDLEHLNLKADDYLMVFEFADSGDLSSYLQKNFKKLKWEHKLLRLIEISCDLAKIHKAGYIHRDFHSGNILLSQIGVTKTDVISYIADLGLSEKVGKYISKGEIYGVLPYTAPEILSGDYEDHTTAADIYGFGIIMVEMSTGLKPFDGVEFNTRLVVDICRGLRPEFSPETPDCYIELANRCMHKEPQKRPTAIDVAVELRHQYEYIKGHKTSDKLCIKEKFLAADKAIKNSPMIRQKLTDSTSKGKIINRNKMKTALNEDLVQPTESIEISID